MKVAKVKTKKELQCAVNSGCDKIIVIGDLAKQVSKAYSVRKYSKCAMAALGTALIGVATTGPVGTALAVPVAAVTGIEIALIVAVTAIGVSLVITLTEHYSLEVEIGTDENGKMRIRLTKKMNAVVS